MIKQLFILSSLAFSSHAFACTITKSSVVMFVDANNSPQEIEKAREAACDRGEALVVAGPGEIESKTRELARSNKPISSLIASGHDGGGSFYGSRGHISKASIIQGIQRGYQGKEELLDNLEGLFLWGCYTTVPSEIVYWKSAFPKAKFIIGFHGAGPSNVNPSGLRMLKSSLIAQDRVCSARNEQELKRIITSISDLRYTSVGAFAQSCRMDQSYYLMQRLDNTGTMQQTTGTLESQLDCRQIRRMAESNVTQFHRYFSGELAIPQDTSRGELRDLYSFVRQNAQCFNNDFVVGDRVGSLLFFDGVKKNFGKVFEREINDAVSELGQLSRYLDRYNFSEETAAINRAQSAYNAKESEGRTLSSQLQSLQTQVASKEREFEGMSRRTRRYLSALESGNDGRAERREDRLNDEETRALNALNQLRQQVQQQQSRLTSHSYELGQAKTQLDNAVTAKREKENSLNALKRTVSDVSRNFWAPTLSNISNKSRKQVLENITKLSSLTNHVFFNGAQDAAGQIRKLKGLENKMERYLNQLEPDCMNFLEWHEYIPGQVLAGRC